MTTPEIEEKLDKYDEQRQFYTYDGERDLVEQLLTELTQHHEEEVRRAVEEERIRIYHKLEKTVADLTAPTKTDNQKEV